MLAKYIQNQHKLQIVIAQGIKNKITQYFYSSKTGKFTEFIPDMTNKAFSFDAKLKNAYNSPLRKPKCLKIEITLHSYSRNLGKEKWPN